MIKHKWCCIGKVLKIPSKHLEQFTGLTDPLLEVIIHWIKGVGDMPPSWDAIVVSLRDPSINEAELADKISRIYCDHRQEGIKAEGGQSTASGKYYLPS